MKPLVPEQRNYDEYNKAFGQRVSLFPGEHSPPAHPPPLLLAVKRHPRLANWENKHEFRNQQRDWEGKEGNK